MLLMLAFSVFLMFYSLKNYRNAVYFTSCVLILQTHLNSGVPGVRLFYLVALFQLYLFYVRGEFKRGKNLKYPLLLLVPCIIATIGYLLSSYFGVCKVYAEIFISSVCTFIYPVVIYKIITTKEHLHGYLKVFLAFYLIAGVYTIVELLTNLNVYSLLIAKLDLAQDYYGGINEKVRYGMRRCNSLFAFCSTLGMAASVAFFVISYLRVNRIVVHRRIENVLFVLMPLNVLLTGTRSQFVVFFICLIPFIFWKKTYQTAIFKVLIFMGVLCVLLMSDYIGKIYDSMSDPNSGGGSSLEMREEQLEVCLYYLDKSPFFGFGKSYISKYVMPYNPDLHGAESVWFRQLVDFGLLGCATYLMMCIGTMFWLYKYDKRLVFFPLAFLAGKTISIVVGVEISYLLITSIILQKICTLYNLGNHRQ